MDPSPALPTATRTTTLLWMREMNCLHSLIGQADAPQQPLVARVGCRRSQNDAPTVRVAAVGAVLTKLM